MASDVRIGVRTDTGRSDTDVKSLRQNLLGLSKDAKGGVLAGVGLGAGIAAWSAVGTAVESTTRYIKDAVVAAAADEESVNRLTASLKANVPAWDGRIDKIEETIAANQRLGFSDEEQRDALTVLAGATHDVAEAQDIMATAMDLARFKGIDLRTASEALIKVEGGHYRALATLGIKLREGASSTEALAAVQRVAAGQAEEYGDTSSGAAAAAGIAFDELQEQIGKGLLPVMKDLAQFASDELVPALSEVGGAIGDAGSGISDFLADVGDAIRGVDKWVDEQTAGFLGTRKELNAMTVAWAEGWRDMADTVDTQGGFIVTSVEEQGRHAVETAKTAFLHPFNQALREATHAAREEGGAVPDAFSSALTDALPDLKDGTDNLKKMLKHELSTTERIHRIQGVLNSEALADGMASKDPYVRAEARRITQSAQKELRELKGGAADAASDGMGAYIAMLREKKRAAALVASQTTISVVDRLKFDAGGAGAGVGNTYMHGLAAAINSNPNVEEVQAAIYAMKGQTIGNSVPQSGPLSAPFLDSHAKAIAKRWTGGLSQELKKGVMPLQDSLRLGVRRTLTGGGSGGGGDVGGITVQLPPTTIPYSPGQYRDAMREMIPELVRELRRQGYAF